jgi:hypothetical protein
MKTKITFKKVNGKFNTPFGNVVNAYVAVNSKNEFGFLPNESIPYMPIGGVKALKSVLDILIFKTI